MNQAMRRLCVALFGALAGWCSIGIASAAPYFVTVTGTPSSITCTNTDFTFGPGATLQWQLASASSVIDTNVSVNGVLAGTNSFSPGSPTGSFALSGTPTSYSAIAFPYTIKFAVVPRDLYTSGVEVAFTCTAGGGTNYMATTIPALAPAFQSSPAPVLFPTTAVGATTASITVTLSNTGTADATALVLTNDTPAEFIVSDNACGSMLPQGASCTLAVAFKPAAAGSRAGSISISAAGGVGGSIQLRGTGTGGATLAVPSPLVFGNQVVGTSSPPAGVTLTNTGTTPVTVSGVTSSTAEFPVTTNCATIPASGTCTVSVTFAPAATGARSGTISVASNASGSPQAIAVSGTGTAVPAAGQLALPAGVTFGTQVLGAAGAPQVVNVTNIGGAPVTVANIANSNPAEFALTSTCTTVAVGGTCSLTLTFTPAAIGTRNATITVVSDGTGSPQAIGVSGTGSAAPAPGRLSISGPANFGSVMIGTTSAPINVTLTNTGGAPVAVASIGSGNAPEFAIAGSTCGNVAVGASCEFSVTFSPGATGPRSATITIASSGTGSPQSVEATGTGVTTPPPPPATADLIEYHHAEWDHYFVTSIPDEITKLDNGVFAGWARTGYKFKSYALGTAGSANVCRFFSTSFAPRSSHFYTPFATECAIVKTNPDWSFEGDVFGIPVPTLAGACPASTVPVYRLYNDGQGDAPNHRYTTELAVRAQMIAKKWVPEGYGDLGVIMCAPI